jgi:hypothetical protein
MLSDSTTITTRTIVPKQDALAQTNDGDNNFKLYENPTFGIRVQYPYDWEKVEPSHISQQESSFNIIVGFVSAKENISDTSLPPAALSIGMHNLSSSSSSYQNITLDQYTDVHVNAIREQEALVESSTTTLIGSNNALAHNVVYVNSKGQEVMQVWTIKENKAYHITYAADMARYPDYLPLAQKIIDSFEIDTMSTQGVQQQQPPTVESNNITTIKDNNTAATPTATPSPCCLSDGYNIANAGPDQTVLEGTLITLNGSSSSNNKSSDIGNTVKYSWRQTDGPAIILNGNNTANPTFVAPNYPNDTKHTFALEVFDENQINNNNNNNQTGPAMDTVDIIAKDVNLAAKNPRALQQEDVNIIAQSNQDELQDEGTTGDDGQFSDASLGEDSGEDDDSVFEEEGGIADQEESASSDESEEEEDDGDTDGGDDEGDGGDDEGDGDGGGDEG